MDREIAQTSIGSQEPGENGNKLYPAIVCVVRQRPVVLLTWVSQDHKPSDTRLIN